MINWKSSNSDEKSRLLKAFDKGEIKNILLFRCQKLGDMLTFLPTILCVRKMFPSARITLACRKDGLAVAERVPAINIMLIDDLGKDKRHCPRYDLMITSSQDAGWIRLKKKLNIKYALGVLPESLKGVCLKHRLQYRYFSAVERYTDSEHDVDRNLKALKPLGKFDCGRQKRTLWIAPSEKETISEFLPDAGARLVVVSPSGSKQSKNWRPNFFAGLCDRLLGEPGMKIIFTGRGTLAREQSDRILEGMKGPALSLIDRTSFGELCALIERADLVISVDSGTAHIASYLDRPLVVIFGPGDLEQWKPWHMDQSLAAVVQAPCECGTTNYRCKAKKHCLDSITPDEVFKAVCGLLNINRKETPQKGQTGLEGSS
ncbi:MAG: glycosyltransferase family 9 protein [Nitrospiraceae bacterium]|nr:MAG: glycosyltransferase family 9 protein [Nitrospiraceae bacterium]